MEATPNGVIIVDDRLRVQDLSPSAEDMLGVRRNDARGRRVHEILPTNGSLAEVRDTGRPVLNRVIEIRPDLIVEQSVVPVHGQSLMVAILRDVTDQRKQHQELEHIRRESLARTREVVRNQMLVAHEIAQLLGETTAESRVALSRLAKLLEEGDAP